MIMALIILSTLTAVLGQEYEIMNNLVDFDDSPYQRMSPPYLNHNNGGNVINLRSKLLKNGIVESNRFGQIKRPIYVIEPEEGITSLASIHSSLMATINGIKAKILGYLKSALTILKINIPAIIVGAVVTVGFCKATSLCTTMFSIHSIKEALTESTAFFTQEQLDSASNFLQEALKRFGVEPEN